MMNPVPRLLGDLLQATAERWPHKEATVYKGQRTTWAELNQQVNKLASAFLAMGLQPGDRIGVLCTTRPEYLCVYMAAARVGAIMVGFSVQYTPRELLPLMSRIRPKVMVVLDVHRDRRLAESLKAFFDELGFVQAYVVIGKETPSGAISYDAIMAADRRQSSPLLASRQAVLSPDDGVLIVFTSGSTGEPKAAVLTHRCILDNILVQVRQFAFTLNDRVLQNKPMNHVGGTTNLTLPAVAVGATLVFMDHFHPVRALEAIARERVSILGQVPTMFIMQLELPNFADFDLTSLKKALVAGAPTPPLVMRRIMGMAHTVITGYGLTEVGGYVTYTRPDDDPETVATTVGAIAPEFELRVVDAARQPLPSGSLGEVAIRGSCVFAGYFDNPEATSEVKDAEGWFYTGDMGSLDQRGYLSLVGRKKEMYISGGYNIYPREIEQYLSLHPSIAYSTVIGMAEPVWGEVGVAFVAVKPGHEIASTEVRDFCRQGLAEYKIPHHFLVRRSLPLTPMGKIDRLKLVEEWEQWKP
jgi:acyl-CoA synthetase (AMP-forming)/AMP-acid ligase II